MVRVAFRLPFLNLSPKRTKKKRQDKRHDPSVGFSVSSSFFLDEEEDEDEDEEGIIEYYFCFERFRFVLLSVVFVEFPIYKNCRKYESLLPFCRDGESAGEREREEEEEAFLRAKHCDL